MATSDPDKQGYTRQTLEETPERALQFLSAVGTSAGIRASLASRGYTDAEHRLGWKLLHTASGYDTQIVPEKDDRAASLAIAEIDAWDEPNFRLARAALSRHFPEQARFLFNKLAPATGAAALLTVRTFLDRLDVLEGKAKADKEAVALLEKRGITAAERARLRKLLATAESGVKPAKETELAAEAEAQGVQREQTLGELRAWFDEWAEVARVVITRRDYLIRLGLARRRTSKKDDEPADAGHDTPPSQ